MWQCRSDYLPTREPFLTLELATSPNYMDWFRQNSKLYLLSDATVGYISVKGQDEHPTSLGRENMPRGDQQLL
ncbi:hypothetical protein PVK06_020095 [Gossypium arboreum]|uniref:Uncharacterized protein n=1 Tax=Gossypium arboreum TaxID=29729 RepID=A0ABR0PLY8_GOSAR|nr:hypothetical protein PVK06_020095 [Gossypium arboreum]